MIDMTLARGLRERSTMRGLLATLSQRIFRFAVIDKGQNPDFRAETSLMKYEEKQAELRDIKTKCIKASIRKMVRIPEGFSVPEAGCDVPVYQAILIRDDLKGLRNVLARLIELNVEPQRIGGYGPDAATVIEKERTFDFEKVLERHDKLQADIDDLDGLIQATDATTNL